MTTDIHFDPDYPTTPWPLPGQDGDDFERWLAEGDQAAKPSPEPQGTLVVVIDGVPHDAETGEELPF